MKQYLTNNEVARALNISVSGASAIYERGFNKLLERCYNNMKCHGLQMSKSEIIVLFVKFGWITEKDIPKSTIYKILDEIKKEKGR